MMVIIFIDTNELLPSRYFIDLRINRNNELIVYRNMLEFDIVNDVTEEYI